MSRHASEKQRAAYRWIVKNGFEDEWLNSTSSTIQFAKRHGWKDR
jgi:hypothetical protein